MSLQTSQPSVQSPIGAKTAQHVFFFRGLSTMGSDNVRWGALNLGPMHRHMERELAGRGLTFHPVLNMGAGTLADLSERAWEFLRVHPIWLDSSKPVHFLGHSAGGLVARLLLNRPDMPANRVASLLTVATPHRGTQLAQIGVDLHERYRKSYWALRAVGYDTVRRRDFFYEFTPQGIQQLFATCAGAAAADVIKAGRVGSIVCAAPRSQWCWQLRSFYKLQAFNDYRALSDGMIERDTQAFGDVFRELPVDHFQQLGVFGDGRRFGELCDAIREFIG